MVRSVDVRQDTKRAGQMTDRPNLPETLDCRQHCNAFFEKRSRYEL